MNTRRLICALLGLWLGASLFMAGVAAFSFRNVNEVLTNPQPDLVNYIKTIGPETMRLLFRHEAAELNRALFEGWGALQIGIGLLLFGILLFGTKQGRLVLGLSLLLVLLSAGMHLLVTPSIVGYGRSLDFIAAGKDAPLRQRVRAFHNAYSTLEGLKLVCLVALLTIFLREVPRRPGRAPSTELEEEVEAA